MLQKGRDLLFFVISRLQRLWVHQRQNHNQRRVSLGVALRQFKNFYDRQRIVFQLLQIEARRSHRRQVAIQELQVTAAIPDTQRARAIALAEGRLRASDERFGEVLDFAYREGYLPSDQFRSTYPRRPISLRPRLRGYSHQHPQTPLASLVAM